MVMDLERQIDRAVQAGVGLDEIEAAIIEPAPLDEDQQAALWLYAEALSERRDDAMLEPCELALVGS